MWSVIRLHWLLGCLLHCRFSGSVVVHLVNLHANKMSFNMVFHPHQQMIACEKQFYLLTHYNHLHPWDSKMYTSESLRSFLFNFGVQYWLCHLMFSVKICVLKQSSCDVLPFISPDHTCPISSLFSIWSCWLPQQLLSSMSLSEQPLGQSSAPHNLPDSLPEKRAAGLEKMGHIMYELCNHTSASQCTSVWVPTA